MPSQCWKQRTSAWWPMRLLLDECVPARLTRAIPTHQVSTVPQEGWSGVKNGNLLALAASKFDVFITVDKNLPYQQNTTNLPVAIVVLDTLSNELSALLPLIPELLATLERLEPRSYVFVRGSE